MFLAAILFEGAGPIAVIYVYSALYLARKTGSFLCYVVRLSSEDGAVWD